MEDTPSQLPKEPFNARDRHEDLTTVRAALWLEKRIRETAFRFGRPGFRRMSWTATDASYRSQIPVSKFFSFVRLERPTTFGTVLSRIDILARG